MDTWLDREHTGRGAIFAHHRLKDLIQSTHDSASGESKLPKFWIQALKALQKLPLSPADPNHFSQDGIKSIPFWFNTLFIALTLKREEFWRKTLRLNTIKDLLKVDGTKYKTSELVEEIHRLARIDGDYIKVARGEWTKLKALVEDWNKCLQKVPKNLLAIAQGQTHLKGYSEVSQKLMRTLGWKPGEGLGKSKQGLAEPVSVEKGQTDRAGLGLHPRKKGKKASKKDTLIALWAPDGIKYGKSEGLYFREYRLDIKGRPQITDNLEFLQVDRVRRVLYWGSGVVGIAESTFPHPKEWRLGDLAEDLDKLTVKALTGALTRLRTKSPTCLTKWPERVPSINLYNISLRYSTGILNPTDYSSHYKLIIHRMMLTNPHNPEAASVNCRLCNEQRESILHWGECKCIKPIYELMRTFDKGPRWNDVVLNLFGQHGNGRIIDPGVSLIHFVLWKYILIN